MLGWDVYTTFYVPTWMLGVLATVIVVMPGLAILVTRNRAPVTRQRDAAP
jgi:hypothetical protein